MKKLFLNKSFLILIVLIVTTAFCLFVYSHRTTVFQENSGQRNEVPEEHVQQETMVTTSDPGYFDPWLRHVPLTLEVNLGDRFGDFVVTNAQIWREKEKYHIDMVGTTTLSGALSFSDVYDDIQYCFTVDEQDVPKLPAFPNDNITRVDRRFPDLCFRNSKAFPLELKARGEASKPYWRGKISVANYSAVYAPEGQDLADFVSVVK